MARKTVKPRGIFERPTGSGIWWARYRDAHGKLHREQAGTQSEAVLLYARRRAEIEAGTYDPSAVGRRAKRRPAAVVTVSDAINAYLPESRSVKRSWSDDRRYASLWSSELGYRVLADVTPEDIRRWRRRFMATPTRTGRPPRPATANRIVAFLRRAINVAIENGLQMLNPCDRVKALPEENQQVGLLNDTQESTLQDVFTPRYWHVVELAILTGMRQEEQFRLRRDGVDLHHAVARLTRTKNRRQRVVHLSSRAVEILREQLASHESEWVYPSPRDPRRPRNADTFMHRHWLPAIERAGIPQLRWHDLRATCATRMLEEGATLEEVREQLGHRTLAMVQRYARLVETRQKEAVERLVARRARADAQVQKDTKK